MPRRKLIFPLLGVISLLEIFIQPWSLVDESSSYHIVMFIGSIIVRSYLGSHLIEISQYKFYVISKRYNTQKASWASGSYSHSAPSSAKLAEQQL